MFDHDFEVQIMVRPLVSLVTVVSTLLTIPGLGQCLLNLSPLFGLPPQDAQVDTVFIGVYRLL